MLFLYKSVNHIYRTYSLHIPFLINQVYKYVILRKNKINFNL